MWTTYLQHLSIQKQQFYFTIFIDMYEKLLLCRWIGSQGHVVTFGAQRLYQHIQTASNSFASTSKTKVKSSQICAYLRSKRASLHLSEFKMYQIPAEFMYQAHVRLVSNCLILLSMCCLKEMSLTLKKYKLYTDLEIQGFLQQPLSS